MSDSRLRIGVLASGEGTTLQALLDASARPDAAFAVVELVTNNGKSGALRRARAAGVPAHHLSAVTHPDPERLDEAIADTLRGAGSELVVLAGYAKLLGPKTLERFRGRLLNTHPAPLPRFGGQGMYGLEVHRAVLRAKLETTAVTIHHVDGSYDTGAVVARTEVPVAPDDTPESLAARVQARERAFLVETLTRIASGALRLEPPGLPRDP